MPAILLYPFLASLTIGLQVFLYHLWFHRLSRLPGPRLWAMPRLPMAYNLCIGRLYYRIAELHDQYGTVGSKANNDLSFINPEVEDPIYSKKAGKPELKKDKFSYLKPSTGINGLLFEHDEEEHIRNFNFAFSERSMRDQELIVQKYINLLILRLKENSVKPLDLAEWYTFATFDITSDLMFGETFYCLKDSAMHLSAFHPLPWMKMLFDWVAGAAFLGMSQRFWPLYPVLISLIPKRLKDADRDHTIMTKEKVLKRLNNTEPRPDFLAYVQTFIDQPSRMTVGELIESCRAIVVGGADAMSSVLSGATYFLIQNPAVFKKLQDEIRTSFENIELINMQSISKLEYLYAVIQEVLRLFPPVPGNLSRITPAKGCMIGD